MKLDILRYDSRRSAWRCKDENRDICFVDPLFLKDNKKFDKGDIIEIPDDTIACEPVYVPETLRLISSAASR
jgi:hypothetical protein